MSDYITSNNLNDIYNPLQIVENPKVLLHSTCDEKEKGWRLEAMLRILGGLTNTEKLNLPLSNSKQSASLSDNKQNFLETVSLSILFDNEVWIEVDNTEEILISQVFKEGEELNLEVSKNDEIFVTSGNMGLISIKVNNGQIKFLGSIGEIGRKQIF